MNSSRSSEVLLVLVALVLSAGVAGAVTVGQSDAPGEAAVGSQVTATFTLTELYRNPQLEQWTLEGETGLGNVTWTVTARNQAGNQVNQSSYDGATFQHPVDIDDDVSEIEVRVTGTVPEVANWSYDPAQAFLLAEFRQVRQGGASNVIETYSTHHYTEGSREARRAIDAARAAVGDNQQARATLNNAISAYEAGNFDNAIDLANQAERTAKQARQRSQLIQYAVIAVVAILLIAIVVGAVYWYRSQQTGSKL